MPQKQLLTPRNRNRPLSGDRSATLPIEARMHEQMSRLANQFLDLLDAIPRAGLPENLHQSLHHYFQLATRLWEEVAANRLDELDRDKAYGADIETLKQQIEQLLEPCQKAEQEPHAKVKRRLKRRVQLYRHALKEWLGCLGNDPATMLSDPTESGRILYLVRGYLGLASCNRFDYLEGRLYSLNRFRQKRE